MCSLVVVLLESVKSRVQTIRSCDGEQEVESTEKYCVRCEKSERGCKRTSNNRGTYGRLLNILLRKPRKPLIRNFGSHYSKNSGTYQNWSIYITASLLNHLNPISDARKLVRLLGLWYHYFGFGVLGRC